MNARLAALSPGERIVLLGGVLLVLDLLLVPWHSVAFSPTELRAAELLGFDPTPTAVQPPDRGYGIAAAAITLGMVVQIALTRLAGARLPEPRLPWSQLQLVGGVFVVVVLAFKLLRDTSGLGYGAYSGILAGLLVAYGGFTIAREAGGAP